MSFDPDLYESGRYDEPLPASRVVRFLVVIAVFFFCAGVLLARCGGGM